MKASAKRSLALSCFMLVMIACIGLAMALQRSTLVEWWQPAAICILPACAAAFVLAGAFMRLCGIKSAVIGRIGAAAVAFSLLLGSFYALNYFKSDPSSARIVSAGVSSKHSEEKYQMRRVGRNRYVRGQKQMAYHVVVELPGMKAKEVDVSAGEYVRMRVGRRVDARVERGLFGLPVIKSIDLHSDRKKTNKK